MVVFVCRGLINFGMESSHLGNQTFAELSVMSTSDVNILPLIKKQVRFLNRRVVQLEKENQARRQREFVLYTLGLVYFAFKGFGLMRKFL